MDRIKKQFAIYYGFKKYLDTNQTKAVMAFFYWNTEKQRNDVNIYNHIVK